MEPTPLTTRAAESLPRARSRAVQTARGLACAAALLFGGACDREVANSVSPVAGQGPEVASASPVAGQGPEVASASPVAGQGPEVVSSRVGEPVQAPKRRAADPAVIRAVLALDEERLQFDRWNAPPRAWEDASGSNPFRVQAIPGSRRWIGALRSGHRLQVWDDAGQLEQELPAPPGVTGWTDLREGRLYAVGERSGAVYGYRVGADEVEFEGRWSVEGVDGLRDVTRVGRSLYLADRYASVIRRIVLPLGENATVQSEVVASCPGALAVRSAGDIVAALCLLNHRVWLWAVDADGAPTGAPAEIQHDGPIWSIALHATPEGARLLMTGIEDHPLVRIDGAFGYIDSFAYVADVTARGETVQVEQRQVVHLSEHGVVTPKWGRWDGPARFWTAAYGSDRAASVDLSVEPPAVKTYPLPPGTTDLVGSLDAPGGAWIANPLLDGWVRWQAGDWSLHPVGERQDPEILLGEALVFTTLMAPANRSEGHQSRFTCEACHFEGTVDGRTHFTGRGEVYATTKTLRGLVGNRPHFSRALDRTTGQMIINEFRVANRGSGHDPWFSLRWSDAPWLPRVPGTGEVASALDLRRAVLRFFAVFQPEAHPAAVGRIGWTERERRGADVFARHCEGCHQARRLADREDSRISPEAWEEAWLDGLDVLWARSERIPTGVMPYVHREGARVPSLRRLFAKAPYFTRGSAWETAELLDHFDLGPPLMHETVDGPRRPLSDEDKAALNAFLKLL